jgi:tetratricopeptide (TPR) repeat protein
LLRKVERLKEGIAAYQNAAAIFRQIDFGYGQCLATNDLADALAEAGRLEEAISAYQDAVAIAREIGAQDQEDSALQGSESIRALRKPEVPPNHA